MTGYLGNFEDGCEMTYVLLCFMSFVYVRRWAFRGVCSARGAQQRSQLRSVHKLKSGGLWFLFLMLKSEKTKVLDQRKSAARRGTPSNSENILKTLF